MAPRAPFSMAPAFNTSLSPMDELQFRGWVQQNKVPFDPSAAQSDYDMRGFWQAGRQGNPQASTALNPNDGQMHYPDYWKTPLHQSFSNESQWAPANAPQWVNDSQLASPNGRVVYDEKAPKGLLYQ
jgi:hypothetical protein